MAVAAGVEAVEVQQGQQAQGAEQVIAAAGAQQQPPTQSLLITPIPDEQAKALVASIGDQLSFLWDEYKVPLEIQARLIQLGVTEVNVFSKLESGEPGMRDFIREEVNLKAQDGMRTHVGRLLSAWEAAHLRGGQAQAGGS